jgi:hypothetical protein
LGARITLFIRGAVATGTLTVAPGRAG